MKDFKVYQASGYLTKLVTDASDVRKEYEEISGSLVQFDTPISAPLASLLVDINPVQSGSGDPSPVNVRPITGWTGCNVWVKPEYDTSLPATASVTFPDSAGTVYGGTVDLVSGLLTVDYGEVDLGSLSWAYSSGATRFYINILSLDLNIKYPTDPSKALSGLCEELSVAPWATITTNNINNAIAVKNDGTEFNVRCTTYTDAASFKTAMSGVQLVYELAEPIEIQLTPQEINTLIGVNNIWADTGDVSVKYRTH